MCSTFHPTSHPFLYGSNFLVFFPLQNVTQYWKFFPNFPFPTSLELPLSALLFFLFPVDISSPDHTPSFMVPTSLGFSHSKMWYNIENFFPILHFQHPWKSHFLLFSSSCFLWTSYPQITPLPLWFQLPCAFPTPKCHTILNFFFCNSPFPISLELPLSALLIFLFHVDISSSFIPGVHWPDPLFM